MKNKKEMKKEIKMKCFWDGKKMIHIFEKTGKYSDCIRCECGEKNLDIFPDYGVRKMTFEKIRFN